MKVVEILKTVPEKRLRIFGVIERATVKGKLDYSLVDPKELNLADAEARSYSQATQAAVRALREVKCC